MLQVLGLLVDVVPGHAHHIGEEALDHPVAGDQALRVLAAVDGERDRALAVALDVAVALQAPQHLVHGGGRQLHGPGQVGARHGQPGLEQPEQALQIFLLGDGGRLVDHRADRSGGPTAARSGPTGRLGSGDDL